MSKDPAPAPQNSVPMEELRRIVKLMKDNDLTDFQFEKEGFKVRLRRGTETVVHATSPATPLISGVPASNPSPAASGAAPAAPVAEGEEITSPMVGTFYRSPSPEAAAFVEPGDNVQAGDTLCIIEAMKVMNEIKAEKSGTILSVVAEDRAPVQFGAVLFRIK